MSRSRMVSLLATVAMLGAGSVVVGCGHEAIVATVPAVPVVEVPAPAAVAVVAPPPAPKLATVCDAEIRPQGHLHFPHEVEFDQGKATIKASPTSSAILQCLVDFLGNNAMVTKFRIEGHTDNQGDATMNQTLSEARAQAIVGWLGDHGVSKDRVWGKGFGPTRPVAPNDTPDNMAKNRRVEFHIDEINGAKATKESIALAMNPPVVAVTSVAVPTATVGVAVPSVSVAVPSVAVATPSIGVVGVAAPGVKVGGAVAVPSVAVAVPSVAVGVGVGGIGVAGGGAAGGGKAPAGAAKKEDDKKKK